MRSALFHSCELGATCKVILRNPAVAAVVSHALELAPAIRMMRQDRGLGKSFHLTDFLTRLDWAIENVERPVLSCSRDLRGRSGWCYLFLS